jgi:hypothetical protein
MDNYPVCCGVTDMTEFKERAPRDLILDTAKQLISGKRAEEYGDAYDNFERIAALWNAYLSDYLNGKQTGKLLPHDVAALMMLVKLARIANNPKSWDSWVDIIGYAALGAETVERNK